MDAQRDYWQECISIAADECEVILTPEQLAYIADSVEAGHDNYGMAFYSPPSTDRINEIEREWRAKYAELQRQFDKYRNDAELAVKIALYQHRDAQVSIGEHGKVVLYDGRTDRIQ